MPEDIRNIKGVSDAFVKAIGEVDKVVCSQYRKCGAIVNGRGADALLFVALSHAINSGRIKPSETIAEVVQGIKAEVSKHLLPF